MLTEAIILNDSKHEFEDENKDRMSVTEKVEKRASMKQRKNSHGNDANLLQREAELHYLRLNSLFFIKLN